MLQLLQVSCVVEVEINDGPIMLSRSDQDSGLTSEVEVMRIGGIELERLVLRGT